MAETIPGYFLEQKVQTVLNDDASMNAAIDAAAAEDPPWVVTNLFVFPSGVSVIILFTRQSVTVS